MVNKVNIYSALFRKTQTSAASDKLSLNMNDITLSHLVPPGMSNAKLATWNINKIHYTSFHSSTLNINRQVKYFISSVIINFHQHNKQVNERKCSGIISACGWKCLVMSSLKTRSSDYIHRWVYKLIVRDVFVCSYFHSSRFRNFLSLSRRCIIIKHQYNHMCLDQLQLDPLVQLLVQEKTFHFNICIHMFHQSFLFDRPISFNTVCINEMEEIIKSKKKYIL